VLQRQFVRRTDAGSVFGRGLFVSLPQTSLYQPNALRIICTAAASPNSKTITRKGMRRQLACPAMQREA
jgi:hypothetical protein